MTAYIDIVFPDRLDPAGHDLQIIRPATPDTPGRATLGKAKKGQCVSVDPPTILLHSHNGGAMLGYLAEGGEPLAPFQDTYWLEEEQNAPTS